MGLLDELIVIKYLLDTLPSDSVPKRHAANFNIAKNQLMGLIAKGERLKSQKNLSTVHGTPDL